MIWYIDVCESLYSDCYGIAMEGAGKWRTTCGHDWGKYIDIADSRTEPMWMLVSEDMRIMWRR